MISLHTIEFIVSAITLFCAYAISVTLTGLFEGAVARWAGDDTPAEAGFLSGNPLYYIDFFGLLCALLVGFGWGSTMPFNPYNVTGRRRTLKVFLVYIAQPMFSLFLAFMALLGNLLLVGKDSLGFAFWNLVLHAPMTQLTAVYPAVGSGTLVVVMLLLGCITLNAFMATWGLINNFFHFILFVGAEHGHDYMKHAEALAFFGPLLVLFFFTGPLRIMFLRFLVTCAYFLALLIGVKI